MFLLPSRSQTTYVETVKLEFRTELTEEIWAICDKMKSLNEHIVRIEENNLRSVSSKEAVDGVVKILSQDGISGQKGR